ncbi:MAG: glycoside hydrolase family 43 protein, partial [Muribaculaceae bacterium]
MEKKFLFFILLFLFGVKSLSAVLQVDSLATYEKPMGSEKIEITSWCESPAQSWVLYTGEVNNPVKNALNSSERCFQVTLGANHNWKKNFLTFNLKSPIIITENNRFLHIKHYREILNDNWMVCLNTDQDLSESLNYKCRFNGNNSKAGEWETIVIDLKYLMITNTPLSKFSFGISMDWSGPRDNPGAIYLFDDIVLSESNAVPVEKVEYSTFPNGKDWIDDRGIPINAHGGQIIYENDTYYWIGEARNRFTTLGISCYSSKDLYNWKYEGHILDMQNAEFKTDMQDVAHGRLLERPKVVYNKKTKKYVMWVHWENGANYSEARVMVAEGDKITGPFRFVKTFRPNATMSRDQTLFQDTDDAVYQFRASEENATMHVSKLSDNYLDVANESEYSRIFIKQAYEAPAIFKHNDKYFGIFSGCTGWEPNSAKSGEASNITSEWKYINNPCTDVDKNKTYFSQSAYVLPIPNNENAYIYIGDRWDKNSPGNSSYVFLPITMRTGKPAINWYETWDLSLFDQINSYKQTIDIADGKEIYLIARHCDKFFSMSEEKVVLWKDDYAKNLKVTLHLIKDDWYKIEYNGHFLDYVDNELSFV